MGIKIFSNSGVKAYGIKHFILDKEDDLNNLSTSYTPGSSAFIIATSENYILNTQHEWIKITAGGNGSNSPLDNSITLDGNNF